MYYVVFLEALLNAKFQWPMADILASDPDNSKLAPAKVRYDFGSYVLMSGQELLCDGDVVHTPPKELALLEMLVQAEGELVSAQQIENQLWPNQQVSYASIARCVLHFASYWERMGRSI